MSGYFEIVKEREKRRKKGRKLERLSKFVKKLKRGLIVFEEVRKVVKMETVRGLLRFD